MKGISLQTTNLKGYVKGEGLLIHVQKMSWEMYLQAHFLLKHQLAEDRNNFFENSSKLSAILI